MKNRKNRAIVFFVSTLFLVLSVTTSTIYPKEVRSKIIKVGKGTWYTERNTLDQMLAIAKKENKPLFIMFTAQTCKPCQWIKKNVFTSEAFPEVIKDVIPMMVKRFATGADSYLEKYNIRIYPTFMMIAPQGHTLETGYPTGTVDGYKKWIAEVMSGNNYYELSQRVEKNPKDRDALLKLIKKIRFYNHDKIIKWLKHLIALNPDFNDEISHRAYERLLYHLASNIESKNGYARKKLANENNELVDKIIESYYPGNFKYYLAHHYRKTTISWMQHAGKHKKAVFFFEHLLKKRSNCLDFDKDLGVFIEVFPSLLHIGREKQALKMLEQLEAWFEKAPVEEKKYIPYALNRIYRPGIEFFGTKGQTAAAEQLAIKLFKSLKDSGNEHIVPSRKIEYAWKYLLFAGEMIEEIEKKLPQSTGTNLAEHTGDLARIYARKGDKKKAKHLLLDLYKNRDAWKNLTDKRRSQFYNTIAWAMVEAGIADRDAIRIAEHALKLNNSPNITDTAASIYAALSDYKTAVQYEKKAVEMLKKPENDHLKEKFSNKILEWQNKLVATSD